MDPEIKVLVNQEDVGAIVTDCLSCRLQFTQLLPYDVIHPIELLRESCALYEDHKSAENAGS